LLLLGTAEGIAVSSLLYAMAGGLAARLAERPTGQLSLAEKDMPVEQMTHSASFARLAATRDCHAHA
jgi:hypothetical protein